MSHFHLIGGGMPTDEQLLKLKLVLDAGEDPRQLAGVVWEIPAGVELDYIEFSYNYREEKLGCIVCGKAVHYKGYVVRLTDDGRVLIGHQCGARQFGGSWEEREAYFRRLVNRQDYLERIAPLADQIETALSKTANWRQPLAEFRSWRRELRRASPALFKKLWEIAFRADGRLFLEQAVRDYATEATRDAFKGKSAKKREIYKTALVPCGRLAGTLVFREQEPSESYEEAVTCLRGILSRLQAKRPSDGNLKSAFTEKQRALELLRRAHETYSDYFSFSAPSNLRTLANWITETPLFNFRCAYEHESLVLKPSWDEWDLGAGSGLIYTTEGERKVIPLPALRRLDHSALDILEGDHKEIRPAKPASE